MVRNTFAYPYKLEWFICRAYKKQIDQKMGSTSEQESQS